MGEVALVFCSVWADWPRVSFYAKPSEAGGHRRISIRRTISSAPLICRIFHWIAQLSTMALDGDTDFCFCVVYFKNANFNFKATMPLFHTIRRLTQGCESYAKKALTPWHTLLPIVVQKGPAWPSAMNELSKALFNSRKLIQADWEEICWLQPLHWIPKWDNSSPTPCPGPFWSWFNRSFQRRRWSLFQNEETPQRRSYWPQLFSTNLTEPRALFVIFVPSHQMLGLAAFKRLEAKMSPCFQTGDFFPVIEI